MNSNIIRKRDQHATSYFPIKLYFQIYSTFFIKIAFKFLQYYVQQLKQLNMLHSRLTTPKLNQKNNNNQSSRLSNPVIRSKSSASFAQIMATKLQYYQNFQKNTEGVQKKSVIRVNSAFRKKKDQQQLASLSKVSSLKGKLHLGKIMKPSFILSTEIRNNPWAQPVSIDQNLINKKGLMDIIIMGAVPKNIDFTQLLNNRYQQRKLPFQVQQLQQKQKTEEHGENGDNFFSTHPALLSKQQINQPPNTQRIEQPQKQKIGESQQNSSSKIMRRKLKKNHSSKKNKKQMELLFKQQPIVLQISNQTVVKDQKYHEQLKKLLKNGNEPIFKQYIKKVQEFAIRYGLKKFRFQVLLDETKKMSDTIIKHQILNAKPLGIYLAMKGNIKKRVYQVTTMLAIRYKFKKSLKDILKIQKIKRYFKIKKYYEQMTKKRYDFLKFKLGSFAERQRRFIEESGNEMNERFRTQIHLLSISGKDYEEQISYYKLECRNNIQLTRIFNQKPEYIILLMHQEQCNITSWLKLLQKVKGYHPTIVPICSSLKNAKIRNQDSIYYGLNSEVIKKVRKMAGKKQDVCLFSSSFSCTVVKISQAFNSKLYSSTFWKPHLQKLLIDDEQQINRDNESLEGIKQTIMLSIDQKYKRTFKNSNQSSQAVSLDVIGTTRNIKGDHKNMRTQAQIKHIIQRAKIKQLNSFQLASQRFSNKRRVKEQIFLQFGFETPKSIIFKAGTQQKQLFTKFTEIVLVNKNINKWVFKIATSARFSRGLAFLETDSLKILKEKKKKNQLSTNDITEVANIMKIILIDKLQIPQNSLLDSNEFLAQFLLLGGYVQAVIVQANSQCIFARISAKGNLQILGTYSKIYTQQGINCAGTYPSENVTFGMIEEVKKLSQRIYEKYKIFGNITCEFVVDKKTKKQYFIDIILCLEQYSSLYFMYIAFFNHIKECSQSLTIIKKVSEMKMRAESENGKKIQTKEMEQKWMKKKEKGGSSNEIEQKQNILQSQAIKLSRKIIYIPFIDNNGNIYETFEQFEQSCAAKSIKTLDIDDLEGVQFLYLNLKQQRPDVLSLVAFSKDEKKVFKHTLDGLNFLVNSGERTNKFDKKVERRKYDCLYIYDIIWKFRQMKKYKDSLKIQ